MKLLTKRCYGKQSLQILETMMANRFVFTPEFVKALDVILSLSPHCLLCSGHYCKPRFGHVVRGYLSEGRIK